MLWIVIIGGVFIVIAGICVGAWSTGYQQRGNFNTERDEERMIKKKIATWSVLVGIASFAVAGIMYLLN